MGTSAVVCTAVAMTTAARTLGAREHAAVTGMRDQHHALRFMRCSVVLLALAIFFGSGGSASADPTAPTKVQASGTSVTSVRLTWTRSSVEGSSGYQIFRCVTCYPASTP